jgi:hypothetical protein
MPYRTGRAGVVRFAGRAGVFELENQPRHQPTPPVKNKAKTKVITSATLMAMRNIRRAKNRKPITKTTIRMATAVELNKYSFTAFGSWR